MPTSIDCLISSHGLSIEGLLFGFPKSTSNFDLTNVKKQGGDNLSIDLNPQLKKISAFPSVASATSKPGVEKLSSSNIVASLRVLVELFL